METPDLDPLLHRLRHRAAPASLGANVLSRLGPPARQIEAIFLGGVCACLAGILLSTAITLEVTRDKPVPAPPLLGLFSEDIGPFASL
ncbi:MAG: hypothetical protein GXX91_03370 [Verrucomicrobiaceae bacterium]|nr:hypothetical protein [Verrucomicrobiaceae bacterium]